MNALLALFGIVCLGFTLLLIILFKAGRLIEQQQRKIQQLDSELDGIVELLTLITEQVGK